MVDGGLILDPDGSIYGSSKLWVKLERTVRFMKGSTRNSYSGQVLIDQNVSHIQT